MQRGGHFHRTSAKLQEGKFLNWAGSLLKEKGKRVCVCVCQCWGKKEGRMESQQ